MAERDPLTEFQHAYRHRSRAFDCAAGIRCEHADCDAALELHEWSAAGTPDDQRGGARAQAMMDAVETAAASFGWTTTTDGMTLCPRHPHELVQRADHGGGMAGHDND